MALLTASLLFVGMLAKPAPAPALSEAPGGYRTLGEQRDRQTEPKDGEDELTVGSVLLSLGIIRVGAAALTVWMSSQPSFCPADDPSVDCGPLRTYGWVGFGEGGLMLGTGIVYLAMGAHHRQVHDAWRRGEPLSLQLGRGRARLSGAPWVLSGSSAPDRRGPSISSASRPMLTGGGLRVRVRF